MPDILSSFSGDLNIAIIGASGGIGRAFCDLLGHHDKVSNLIALSRASVEDQDLNGKSFHIDIEDEVAIARAASYVQQYGPLDIVLVTTGMLHKHETIMPEKSLKEITADKIHELLAINTVGPALLMKHFLPLLNRDRKSVFAALSARVGSISDNQLGGWYSYRASKAALNMIVKTASIEVNRKNKNAAIIALHPGTVETALSAPFKSGVNKDKFFTPVYAAEKLVEVINNVTPDSTGGFLAWDGSVILY